MFADTFLSLTRKPGFRRMIWRPIYEFLPRLVSDQEWRFMNYGYVPIDGEVPVELQEEDEKDRYSLQLYHYLASRTEVEGKEMLEVGSGRGGGAYYISRYLKPAKYTALDLSSKAVELANKYFSSDRLTYVQGNAERLPFPDESFDVVINVESSHAYGSFQNFLAEVFRVLRKGGVFLITDIRNIQDQHVMDKYLKDSGFLMIEKTEITEQVARAIEMENELKIQRIDQLIPRWLRPLFYEFAGVKDSEIHRNLLDKSRLYHRWVFRKEN
jgi:ubiquinone/menaquinone biosynthesis C-methylase UbiE